MSYLEKEVKEEDVLVKAIDEEFGHKILFLGLAQTGKSSIIRVVFEGMNPQETNTIQPTIRFTRKVLDFSGLTLNVYDVGGQISYLEEAYVALRESIFSQVKVLFFIIDSANFGEYELAKNYFLRAMKNIEDHSKTAKVIILAHKIDLIPEEKREETVQTLKEFFYIDKLKDIILKGSSIFDESIFEVITFGME